MGANDQVTGTGKSAWARCGGALAALIALTLVVGCTSESTPRDEPASAAPSKTPTANEKKADTLATVVSVTDGDTLNTSLGIVRVIGMDTPEREQCGYAEASGLLTQLIPPGVEVTLTLPDGQNDRDRHDRLLRYVTSADGKDVGLAQIEAGLAVARYDSIDGYPAHPRQDAYRAAQLATLDANRNVITQQCAAQAEQEAAAAAEAARIAAEQAAAQAAAEAAAAPVDAWWTQYSSCSKLKRNSVGHPTGPFNVNNPAETEIYNWFQFGTGNNGDGDGDGFACE